MSFNSQRCKPWSASREYPGTSVVPNIYKRSTKDTEYSAAEIYADDTTISANVDYRSAPGALNQVLQAHVGKVAQWTTDNKMVLNESKTKVMLVAGKRLYKTMSSTSLTVHVNSLELEQVQFHKLLGVIIDTQLNFNEDIENLCKKVT